MSTETDKPTVTHANAQEMIRALKVEKAGFESRGLRERAAAVDEQIRHWTQVAKDAPVNPDDAGEVRASDEQINAEKMLSALKDEYASVNGVKGKEARLGAIDEQIKHWTGVVRKAAGGKEPSAAKSPAESGRQTRTT